ncbi:dephospho-CoA kinase domain-containing protein [Hirsutella rhossiliensis]|uniref:Dephospho-CoA kinase domain-containing protein n=1 Tax=Hirsutella rhossiliensis TaxID=111463 RepID=A0A9P8MWG5_9HYPO|nr:dephospho-CoA kinase domain-containing protein [Hirsutella rhossiliensis]KAH0963533.1 dephospho-CoA kinase domain-containing protein [Hirsutella rhossiliensis]
MLLIGLTGSIATGKSTVSSLLSAPPHSLPIIDADVLARKVVEPGTSGYRAIIKHFGPSTPDLLVEASDSMPADGPDSRGRPLNRPALGKRVFGDSEERTRDRAVLNGIVHPAVRREMTKQVLGCYLRGHWAVVLDIPLLFESGLDRFCGVTVVVAVSDRETQLQRLMARDTHLSRDDAEHRVRSQTDVGVKATRCAARGAGKGVVLWNDGSAQELAASLDEAMAELRASSPEWWLWLLLACPPLAVAVAAWRFWQNVEVNRQWEKQTRGKL